MRAYGLKPDVISYSAAISACERPERALELLSEMRDHGLEPDVIAYSAAISACEKGLQPTRTRELLREMRDSGHEPTVITYNAAISACEEPERALELLSEMRDCGLEPDVLAYSAAISVCAHAGRHDQALQLYSTANALGLLVHQHKADIIDLHDFILATALVAVKFELEQRRLGRQVLGGSANLAIITGRGAHSKDGEAVIKPAVAAMLAEPEYCGLGATEDPSNPGRLLISSSKLLSWVLEHSDIPEIVFMQPVWQPGAC